MTFLFIGNDLTTVTETMVTLIISSDFCTRQKYSRLLENILPSLKHIPVAKNSSNDHVSAKDITLSFRCFFCVINKDDYVVF